MFTGIVREVGEVLSVEGGEDGIRIRLRAPGTAAAAAVGDSVAFDGVCLTVTEVDDACLAFDAVPETLSRTALSRLAAGDPVNVEPALRAGEPFGGHIVQGHVDGVGRVRATGAEGEGVRVTVAAPPGILRYCVEKGSITVAGSQPHRRSARATTRSRSRSSRTRWRRPRSARCVPATRSTSRSTCSRSTWSGPVATVASPRADALYDFPAMAGEPALRIEEASPFAAIDEAIEEIRNGKIVVVVDAADRENEGDLTIAGPVRDARGDQLHGDRTGAA